MNKSPSMFFAASISLILLTSTVAIPLQVSAEIPDTTIVPVIVLFNDKVSNQHKSLVKSHGGEVTRTFTIINGMAANLPQNAIDALEKNPSVVAIDPDLEVHALETEGNDIIGATAVQNPPISKTGNNVRVAILDTGIKLNHPEFAGKNIICESVFSASAVCNDGHGHGTHVAGIVGGIGADLAAKGVAPDVDFYIHKVLSDSGSGSFSGIITAIEEVVNEGSSKVISMSLGADITGTYNKSSSNCDNVYTSVRDAIKAAKDAGITVVSAAGNSNKKGVSLPGCYSYNIAVAATDDFDNIASFSSKGGPVEDHGISAPGVSIYSSVPSTGASCCSHPDLYKKLSGTSMATPMVSGSIALLLEQNSSLSPDDIQTKLFDTACNASSSPSCPTGTTPNTEYGYGRINILATINSISSIDPLPSITIDDVTQAEGTGGSTDFKFTVERSNNSGDISVDYATSNGSADSEDYTPITTKTLNFADGELLSQEITVSVTPDSDPEADETFNVDLENCSGCTISNNQGVGTITNDDGAALPTIAIENASMNEGDSGFADLMFTITCSGDTCSGTSFTFATQTDSATPGVDYSETSGLVIFGLAPYSVQIPVTVAGDTDPEADETFNVNLENCSGCTFSDLQGVGTILNDDSDGDAVVDITFAQYNPNRDTLRVKATSTDATETLTAYTGPSISGPWTQVVDKDGVLKNKGGGNYDGRFSGVTIYPDCIKVEPSSGTSDAICFQ